MFCVLTKMGKGVAPSMESMRKVCKVLDCDMCNVMEIKKDDKKYGADNADYYTSS